MKLRLLSDISPAAISATIAGALILAGAGWTLYAQAPTGRGGPGASQAPGQTTGPQLPTIAPGPGGPLSIYGDKPIVIDRPNPLDKLTPVTEAMIANPPVGEWLTWRRSYNATGFSPLKQITKANVSDLRVAWSWTLASGPNENTPLVHDGVIFCHGFGDKVQALDATTGDLLWEYARRLPQGRNPGTKRAMAIYDNKLYFATSDVHMVALDMKTGRLVWDQEIAEKGAPAGVGASGGPLVAKGKVMIGTTGRTPGGPQIVGMDAQTGAVAWRFHTIAQPGEKGDDTWNGLPIDKRNGGSVWVPGTYDPALGLAYFGVAQTYDTGPLRIPVKQSGITNDALYTDSTVAINPDTGKVAWYFQHLPDDQWDLDWIFEHQLIKLPVNGQERTAVVVGGKVAMYDVLDAETGKFIFSYDSGLQNIITAVDPVTGAKKIDISKVPGDGEVKMVCPHSGGSKNWLAASYNPQTNLLFTPLVETCMDLAPTPPGGRASLSTGVNWSIRPRPGSDGKIGRLEAVNLKTRKRVWMTRERAPISSSALDTAGGVVFMGTNDRMIHAYDDATGQALWQTRLNDLPSSSPITYMVNGKQYLAVVVGGGSAHATTFPVLTPELAIPTDRTSSIWVFALPDKSTKPGSR